MVFISRVGGLISLTGALALLLSGCSPSQEQASPAPAQEGATTVSPSSTIVAEQAITVDGYSEDDYLRDTQVAVWDFDDTGEIRIKNGKSVCDLLEKNGWISSDPEAVTLMFANMKVGHYIETTLTDIPAIPEVEGLEKARYLVKYATKAYCPEFHQDMVPTLEDVLARNQEVDEISSSRKDSLPPWN